MEKISLIKRSLLGGLFAASLVFVQGCSQTSGTVGGAAIGTGAGAGIGYAFGGSGGAALGGVIGGLAGGAIGHNVASQSDHDDCAYCNVVRDSDLELERQKQNLERQRLDLERERLELEKERQELED